MRRLAIFGGLLLLAPLAAQAGPADGSVVGVTKIFDKGPAANRFNVVLLADGYTSGEQAQFAQDAQDFLDSLLQTPPFSNNCSAFNVYRVDVISDDSGADDPLACGGSGSSVDTYFDGTFCADGVIQRLTGLNGATAIGVLAAQVPEWDQGLVIINSPIYGGSGGNPGATTVGSSTWENIAIHELGHSAFGLTDEYEYWQGCPDETPSHDNHPAAEPVAANATIETNPALIKWSSRIDGGTAVPTTQNASCDVCDNQANPFPSTQVTGLYEGSHYYHCDAFRPVFSCMMRNFGPFCPVCTQRILQVFTPFQPTNSAPSCDADGPYLAECAGATTSVQLDGDGSSDFDCDELSFAWTGPFTGGAANGASPSVSFTGTGVFTVDLEVGDGAATATCDAEVTVQDTTPPSITAPNDVTVECAAPGGTAVALGTPTVGDVCDPSLTVTNDAPALFPLGTTLVTWSAQDDAGNVSIDTQSVTVEDTTPPTLTVSLAPTLLWPPNHKLHQINATISASDVCDADPTVTLVSITSDEPDNGAGDGNTTADIQNAILGSDDRAFHLRAERQGGGDGRVYTVTYQAADDSGNTTAEQATVQVPHDQRP